MHSRRLIPRRQTNCPVFRGDPYT